MPKSWDEIEDSLSTMFAGSRYEAHAHGLVPVIEHLKRSAKFVHLEPGISLVNLTLSLSDRTTKIYIWCEKPELEYTVYFHDGEHSYDKTLTSLEGIVDILLGYVSKLKELA